ncbi:MAG: hypothetical protein AAFV71_25150 [Cyanobacteria bacterium J06633_8]
MISLDIPIKSNVEIIQTQPCKYYTYSTKEKSTDKNKSFCSLTLAKDDKLKNISGIKSFQDKSEFSSITDQSKLTKNVFTILPVGLNLGKRNVNESILIRGYEDGSKAINFDNWLLPFDDVLSALKIIKTTLDEGQLELRSPGLVKRINPKDLKLTAGKL